MNTLGNCIKCDDACKSCIATSSKCTTWYIIILIFKIIVLFLSYDS